MDSHRYSCLNYSWRIITKIVLEQSGHAKFNPSGQLGFAIGTKNCKNASLCFRVSELPSICPNVKAWELLSHAVSCSHDRLKVHSKDGGFETLKGHGLSWLKSSVVYLSPSRQMPGACLEETTTDVSSFSSFIGKLSYHSTEKRKMRRMCIWEPHNWNTSSRNLMKMCTGNTSASGRKTVSCQFDHSYNPSDFMEEEFCYCCIKWLCAMD